MSHPNEKTAILNLQRYLRQLAYHDEGIPLPPLDGIYHTATQNSLKAFQRKEGLPPTGIADKKTWDLLFDRYNTSLKQTAAPVSIALFPRHPAEFSLRLGDTVFLVSLVQFLLQELELLYGDLDQVTQSGTYDEDTVTATKEFQRRNCLPVTGEINRETWNAMVNAYNQTFGGYFTQ